MAARDHQEIEARSSICMMAAICIIQIIMAAVGMTGGTRETGGREMCVWGLAVGVCARVRHCEVRVRGIRSLFSLLRPRVCAIGLFGADQVSFARRAFGRLCSLFLTNTEAAEPSIPLLDKLIGPADAKKVT